jgi:transforming growth factor-beta-induced protein
MRILFFTLVCSAATAAAVEAVDTAVEEHHHHALVQVSAPEETERKNHDWMELEKETSDSFLRFMQEDSSLTTAPTPIPPTPGTPTAVPDSPTAAPTPARIGSESPAAITQTLLDILITTPELSSALRGVSAAGLNATLDDPTVDLTAFFPLNAAFDLLDVEYWTFLLSPPWVLHLTNLLTYHLTEGSLLSTDLTDGRSLTMVNGEVVTVGMNSTATVLFNSEGLNAYVVATDEIAVNGVAHVVNAVLLPAFIFRFVSSLPAADYSTFVSLLELTNLVSVLEEFGPWTLLAPNNDAFAEIPEETVTELTTTDEGIATLTSILQYHILPGEVYPTMMLTDGQRIPTVLGQDVMVTVMADGEILFGDAPVVEEDILASNGITHGIGAVLSPPTSSNPPSDVPSMVPGRTGEPGATGPPVVIDGTAAPVAATVPPTVIDVTAAPVGAPPTPAPVGAPPTPAPVGAPPAQAPAPVPAPGGPNPVCIVCGAGNVIGNP